MGKQLRTILLVALSYWVLARLGLLLAIPPGFATAVWPPSGLALGAVLIWGYSVAPGIWLGSFLANAPSALGGQFIFSALLLPAGIALGGTAQAMGSAYLIRRFTDPSCALIQDRTILRFFILAGPAGCCISASIGVTLLFLVGKTTLSGFTLNWMTWWAGDTIGAMIFTPLMLVFFGRPETIWEMRRNSVALPLCLSFALVTAFFFDVRQGEQQQRQDEFRRLAELATGNIEDEFQHYQNALYSLRALFDSTGSVSREAFHVFAAQLTGHVNGLQAVEWASHVSNSRRGLFEREQSDTGNVDFSIREKTPAGRLLSAAERDEYVVVTYIEPMESNRPALGYDVASEPKRRAALERARDFNLISATAPIELVQENRRQSGVILFLPVYGIEAASASIGQRRLALKGYVLGVLRVGDVIDTALSSLGGQRQRLRLRLADEDIGQAIPAFYSDPGFPVQAELQAQQTLNLGGRRWLLEISGVTEDFSQPLTAWYVLLGGMLFCGMLGGFLLIVTGRTLRTEALVLERTQALQQLNESLEQRVRDEIEENLQKERLLIQQSRSAAMGEMIGNIAHQWRQPLNALGLTLVNIQDAYEYNELTGEYLASQISGGNQLIHKMSTTIDDFRHFFRPCKDLQTFSAKQAIDEAVALVSASFDNNNIGIELDAGDGILILGFPNEFSQVLLNLLANAKDAILAKRVGQGRVRIRLARDGQWVMVTIADNGGGIPPAVLDKIFEPYFSTKEMGTGIGLYMSKMIIEKSMGGHLDGRNGEDGAEFSIRCPPGLGVAH